MERPKAEGRAAAEELLARGVAACASLGPWPAPERVALAASGGADSTFLAAVWRRFAGAEGLRTPVWVVDHGHRPGTAEEAARAAGAFAEEGHPTRVLRADGEAARANEAALRERRYAALQRASIETGVAVVLTGHHADDQAETVLLRILRGTGLRGLAGMPERRPLGEACELRRPLLALRGAEIRAALRACDTSWIEDPSNADPGAAARNRLRKSVLPQLAGVATGDPVLALLRLQHAAADWRAAVAELLARDAPWGDWPSALRREALAAVLREHAVTISPRRLADLEGALLRRGHAQVDATLGLSLRRGRLHRLEHPDDSGNDVSLS